MFLIPFSFFQAFFWGSRRPSESDQNLIDRIDLPGPCPRTKAQTSSSSSFTMRRRVGPVLQGPSTCMPKLARHTNVGLTSILTRTPAFRWRPIWVFREGLWSRKIGAFTRGAESLMAAIFRRAEILSMFLCRAHGLACKPASLSSTQGPVCGTLSIMCVSCGLSQWKREGYRSRSAVLPCLPLTTRSGYG